LRPSDLVRADGCSAAPLGRNRFLFMAHRAPPEVRARVALIAVAGRAGATLFLMPLLRECAGQVGRAAPSTGGRSSSSASRNLGAAVPVLRVMPALVDHGRACRAIFKRRRSPAVSARPVAWWVAEGQAEPGAARCLGLGDRLRAAWPWLAWNKSGHESAFQKPGGLGPGRSSRAWSRRCLYGISANYTKKRLTGVAPMGGPPRVASSAPPPLPAPRAISRRWSGWPRRSSPRASAWFDGRPARRSSAPAWPTCLYFRLIANVGPARNAIARDPNLVPAFAGCCGAGCC